MQVDLNGTHISIPTDRQPEERVYLQSPSQQVIRNCKLKSLGECGPVIKFRPGNGGVFLTGGVVGGVCKNETTDLGREYR